MNAFGLARLGRDCEVRFMPNGDAVANLSLAFAWGKKGEDGRQQTAWVDGALYGKMAETLTQYLVKGKLICVTLDDVHIEEFQKRDGTSGTKLVGRVSKLELAGGGRDDGERTAPPAQRQAPKPAPKSSASGFDDMDESDVPF